MVAAERSSAPLRRRLQALTTTWHRLMKMVCDPYRPERHYMRGPGPKWHAKHQQA